MNQTKTRVALDFRTMVSESAALYDEKDFLIYKRGGGLESVTFSGLEERVRAFSEGLISLGLAGESIAVVGETAPEWIIAYLATVIVGGTVIPLDKELSREAVAGFLNKVSCRAVVYSSKCKNFFTDPQEIPSVEYLISFGEEEEKETGEAPEKGYCRFIK